MSTKVAMRLVDQEIAQVQKLGDDLELFRLKRRRAELESIYRRLWAQAQPDIIA